MGFVDGICSAKYNPSAPVLCRWTVITSAVHRAAGRIRQETINWRNSIPSDSTVHVDIACSKNKEVINFTHLDVSNTNSPAVAERPRDASCLSVSVVNFNSTIRRVQSSIIGYFGFRFTAACNEILFCSLLFVVVVHAAACDKQNLQLH